MIKLKIGWEEALEKTRIRDRQSLLSYDKDYNKSIKGKIKELNKLIASGVAVVEDV